VPTADESTRARQCSDHAHVGSRHTLASPPTSATLAAGFGKESAARTAPADSPRSPRATRPPTAFPGESMACRRGHFARAGSSSERPGRARRGSIVGSERGGANDRCGPARGDRRLPGWQTA
jgi:hypothetical protein